MSVGLADLIARCLAREAGGRYATAASLAADLRQHLANRPLRGVPNRSLTERWTKWRRRQPYALALLSMRLLIVAALLAAGLIGIVQFRQHAHAAEKQRHENVRRLHDAGILRVTCREDLKKQAYGEALTAARHALILLADMPGNDHLRQVLQQQADLAERGQTVQELHALADQIRYLYGAEQLPAATVEELAGRCREEWGQRRRLLEPAGLDLGTWIEKRLQTDLLDLGLIWADLQVRLAPAKKRAQAQEDALGVLAEVESLFGPNPVLYRERQVLLEGLGRKQEARAAAAQAATCEPKSGWEHYALGRYSYRSGSFKDAAASFERAIDLHPRDFWPHFYAGICAYRLQRYDQAVSAFDVAVALAEQSPECWFNRGLANAALGRQVRARYDFERALKLDPKLAAAALGLGALYYQAQRYAEAIPCLQISLANGADPATVHYHLALVYRAQNDRSRALHHLKQALQHNPDHAQARDLRDRLLVYLPAACRRTVPK